MKQYPFSSEPTVDELSTRLGLTDAEELPEAVGKLLYGKKDGRVFPDEEHIPRAARFFVSGTWMCNDRLATKPEFVDIVFVHDGALIRHHWGIEQDRETTYFFVNSEDYNTELAGMLRSDNCEFLLPPGGLNIEWKSYGDTPLPMVKCAWKEHSRWPFMGYGPEPPTREDTHLITHMRATEQAIFNDHEERRELYEAEDRPAYAGFRSRKEYLMSEGMRVDEPEVVFEKFMDWCQRQSDWSPRECINSVEDVHALARSDYIRKGHRHES